MPHATRLAVADYSRLDKPSPARSAALRISVVYAMQMPDGIVKIGHTTDLIERRRTIHPDAEVIGFTPGTREDEQAIHARLAEHLHHDREWYNPTPEVMAVVNEMRAGNGLPPIRT